MNKPSQIAESCIAGLMIGALGLPILSWILRDENLGVLVELFLFQEAFEAGVFYVFAGLVALRIVPRIRRRPLEIVAGVLLSILVGIAAASTSFAIRFLLVFAGDSMSFALLYSAGAVLGIAAGFAYYYAKLKEVTFNNPTNASWNEKAASSTERGYHDSGDSGSER